MKVKLLNITGVQIIFKSLSYNAVRSEGRMQRRPEEQERTAHNLEIKTNSGICNSDKRYIERQQKHLNRISSN